MAEEIADRDENREPVIIGVSELDTTKIQKIYVNPDTDGAGTHGVIVSIK